MKTNATKRSSRAKRILAACFTVQLAAVMPASAEKGLELITILDDKNIELYSPGFIPNSSDLVIVRKAHEPDYSEAESYSEKELEKTRNQKDKNPRWADPEVTIVSAAGKDRKIVDYGWCPEPTPKGNKIYYIHQLKPISGLRVLAENQKGNLLCSYEISGATKKQLVIPTLGYIDGPIVHPTEDKVAYEICDNTNGAYGGTVGIGVFDERTGKSQTFLEPAKHFKLYDLIGPTVWSKSDLVTLRQTPTKEGTWLADSYTCDILKLALTDGSQSSIYKKAEPIEVYSKLLRIGSAPDGNIELIDNDKLIKLDPNDGKVITSVKRPEGQGMPSPDEKLEAILTEDDAVEVTVRATGKKFKQKIPGQVQTLKWSPDSKKLAAIVTKNRVNRGMDVFDRDCLMLVSIPTE
jgi:hypothetical protein